MTTFVSKNVYFLKLTGNYPYEQEGTMLEICKSQGNKK